MANDAVRRPGLGSVGEPPVSQATRLRARPDLGRTPVRADLASAADIPELVRLMQEFYLESGYRLHRRWATNSFSVLIGDPSLGAAWLLRRDGETAGYCVLTVRFSMEYGGVDACVDDLFVRPAHRRHGAGAAAMAALVAECRRRGVLALHVEVAQDNGPAQRLYRKFGLEPRTDKRQMLSVELRTANTLAPATR